MSAALAATEESTRKKVVDCAERCERWMQWAHQAARDGDVFRVADCMESAGFWSRVAFDAVATCRTSIAAAEAKPCTH